MPYLKSVLLAPGEEAAVAEVAKQFPPVLLPQLLRIPMPQLLAPASSLLAETAQQAAVAEVAKQFPVSSACPLKEVEEEERVQKPSSH
jgi:hypothetical protein